MNFLPNNFFTFTFTLSQTLHILKPHNWTNAYADELFAYAMSKTGKLELAEDLVQETFLAALKAMGGFKGQSSERTWLFAIIKFKIADHYRKASTKYEYIQSRNPIENDDFMDRYFNQDGEWHQSSSPNEWSEDVSRSIENKELGIALNNCIEKLPENQKQLVLLKMVEESETKLVCKELNITPTNYWVIIHRAKLQLRACLEKNWFKA